VTERPEYVPTDDELGYTFTGRPAVRTRRGLRLDEPSAEVVARLRHLARWYFPAGTELIEAVGHLVAEAAVSVYR
jgi:hypothetical protein